jgi:hypothetical protein
VDLAHYFDRCVFSLSLSLSLSLAAPLGFALMLALASKSFQPHIAPPPSQGEEKKEEVLTSQCPSLGLLLTCKVPIEITFENVCQSV